MRITKDTPQAPEQDAPVAPEQQEEQKPIDPLARIVEALEGVEGAPDAFQLEQWKNIHGQVHVSSILADENLYIWRTLKRHDYKSIIKSGAGKDETLFQDAVVNKCLLFPQASREWFAFQNAGTIPSLHKQIMFKSGFVSEEMALSLIDTI